MELPLRLSNEDFAYIYSKVPRFNVDLVLHAQDGGVVLIQRSIEPHIGSWHVPGGTLYKDETIQAAAIRIAKSETGLDVEHGVILVDVEVVMRLQCARRGRAGMGLRW